VHLNERGRQLKLSYSNELAFSGSRFASSAEMGQLAKIERQHKQSFRMEGSQRHRQRVAHI
jgi:hypothetical protein